MYSTFKSILVIVWLLDLFNIPFMQMFDNPYPINGWLWFCIWIVVLSLNVNIKID